MVSIFLTASRLIHVINTWTLLIKGGNELGPSCETLCNGVSMVQINAFSTASTPPDPLQEQPDRFLVDASLGNRVVAEVAHLHAHCLITPPLTEFWSTSALQDCLLSLPGYCLLLTDVAFIWPSYYPEVWRMWTEAMCPLRWYLCWKQDWFQMRCHIFQVQHCLLDLLCHITSSSTCHIMLGHAIGVNNETCYCQSSCI